MSDLVSQLEFEFNSYIGYKRLYDSLEDNYEKNHIHGLLMDLSSSIKNKMREIEK